MLLALLVGIAASYMVGCPVFVKRLDRGELAASSSSPLSFRNKT